MCALHAVRPTRRQRTGRWSRWTRMAKSGHSHSHSGSRCTSAGSASSTMRSSSRRRQRSGQSLTQMSQLLHHARVISSRTSVVGLAPWPAAVRRVRGARRRAAPHRSTRVRGESASRFTTMRLLRNELGEPGFPFLVRKLERRGHRAEQHHVGDALVAELLGHRRGVDRIAFGDVLPHLGGRLARVAQRRARPPVQAGKRRHDALACRTPACRCRPSAKAASAALRPTRGRPAGRPRRAGSWATTPRGRSARG